jgi:hypothetical protein
MSLHTLRDDRPVTLAWITASIEHHEHTVPFGLLRTYLDHARERAGRSDHPDYTRDLDLLKDTWLGVHESEILDYRHIRRITRHDLPQLPSLRTFTVTVAGAERHDGEAGYRYTVHAPDLETAKHLVLEHHITAHEEDIDALTGAPRDPDVIVLEGPWDTFDGAPAWPADLPGREWADLREETGLLERVYRMGPAR